MVVHGEEMVEGSELTQGWARMVGLRILALPALSDMAKYSCLLRWTPREKSSVEEEIKEKEEAIRRRSNEVQVRLYFFFVFVSLNHIVSNTLIYHSGDQFFPVLNILV